MGRIGCVLMGLGFLTAWLMPVVGVLVMVVGGVLTAIESERVFFPDLVGAPSGGSGVDISASATTDIPTQAVT